MAVSITVPTPPGGGQPVTLRVGKVTKECANAAEALSWANDRTADLELLIAFAIRIAATRPADRGKTLTFNPAAPTNLVTLS